MTKKWIQLGVVGKPHGLKGAFFVSQRHDPLPPELKTVVIGIKPVDAPQYKVLAKLLPGGRPVLLCEGASDRDEAESLHGLGIWVERQWLKVDGASEYLWADLSQRQVCDSNGEILGNVVNVVNYGASDIVEVQGADGRILPIPFVAHYFAMDFSDDGPLHLVVTADTFVEAWQKR